MLKAHCMFYIVYIYIKDIDLEILLRTLKQVCELLYKLLLLSGYLDPGWSGIVKGIIKCNKC